MADERSDLLPPGAVEAVDDQSAGRGFVYRAQPAARALARPVTLVRRRGLDGLDRRVSGVAASCGTPAAPI
jgi:hypothetical protein